MNKKLLRKKLALMLATLKKKRPFYTEVEYLESTGTQYIDTLTTVSSTDRVKTRCRIISTEALPRYVFGVFGDGKNFGFNLGSTQLMNGIWGTNSLGTSTGSSGVDYEIDLSSNGFFVNGVKKDNVSGTFTGTKNAYLFYNNGTSQINQANRIYYLQIYHSDTLVRDFIPVLDWNMTPCMYDRVSEQLFYNAGTGDFVAGREIHPVEYLESVRPNTSDGYALTQYIDTKIIPNQNTKIILDAEMTQNYTTSSAPDYYETLIGSFKSPVGFRIHYHINSGKGYFGYIIGSSSSSYTNLVEADLNRHIFVLDAKNSVFSIDNNYYQSSYSISGEQNVMALFAQRGTSAFNASANMKCYGCKIYDDDTLVRDFIPMVDESGVGALFDKVTHTIFDNAGTGAFKYPLVELEYLKSTGTQYIDTGFKLTSNSAVDILVEQGDDVSTNGHWFGGRNSSTGGNGFGVGIISSKFVFDYNARVTASSVTVTSGTKYRIVKDKANNNLYANGDSVYSTANTSATFTTSYNAFIFRLNNRGQSSSSSIKGKLYYCKIYDNDILVRDFIPCYKDGVACMVDKLTGTAYLNQGTGTFSVGRIVEPEYE